MLDKSLVDEEVLLSAALAEVVALGYIAGNLYHIAQFVDSDEPFFIYVTIYITNALGKVARLEVVKHFAVVVESECDIVVGEGYSLKNLFYVRHLDRVLLEEVAAGRHVEEEVLHGQRGALAAVAGRRRSPPPVAAWFSR